MTPGAEPAPHDGRSVRGEPGPDPVATAAGPVEVARGRRGGRRAVRPGAGEADPTGALRSFGDPDPRPRADDADDADDERLRREIPPHW